MTYQYGAFVIESNINILTIKELRIREEVNQHGEAVVKGWMEEREDENFMCLDREEVVIRNDAENDVFTGIVCSLELEKESGFCSFQLIARSFAWKLDSIKRKRVFQNLSMTYGEVIREVLAPYRGSSFIDTASKGKRIPHMLIQFKETDWEFLKRLSSHFNEGICEDVQTQNVRLFFGLPRQKEEVLEGELEHRRLRRLGNQEILTIKAYRRYKPGSSVIYREKPYLIQSSEMVMERGEMIYRLSLVRNKEQIFPYQENAWIAGSRIGALTKEVHGNYIRLQFQIEDKQAGNTPSIPYGGEVNNEDGFYMPEPGDKVDVYFPNAEEESGVVVSARWVWEQNTPDWDCSMKYMGNKQQIKLYMDEKEIGFSTGEGGGEIKMGEDGILIMDAPETLKIEAGHSLEVGGRDHKVSIYAGKRVCLNAGTLEKTSMTLESSGRIVCKASNRVLYKRKEEVESAISPVDENPTADTYRVRDAGLALSGVEFLSQAITGVSDFQGSQRIMSHLLGKSKDGGEGSSIIEESEGNLIKEKLFHNNERLFNSFSYGENKTGS